MVAKTRELFIQFNARKNYLGFLKFFPFFIERAFFF